MKIKLLVVLLSLCCFAQAQTPTETPTPVSNLDLSFTTHSINGTDFPAAIVTHKGAIYYGYIDPNLNGCIAKKDINGNVTSTIVLTGMTPDDNHNEVSIAIDAEGYIHWTGNMHQTPMVYLKSTNAEDISSFTTLNSNVAAGGMYGPVAVSYGRFVQSRTGTLFYVSRIRTTTTSDGWVPGGMAGNIQKYNTDTKQWIQLGSLNYTLTGDKGQTISGGMDANHQTKAVFWDLSGAGTPPANGYQGYKIRVVFDNNNRMHMVWNVAKNPAKTSVSDTHTHLMYAYSDDEGVTWKKTNGSTISLPITTNNGEVVYMEDPAVNASRMYNFCNIAFANDNQPILLQFSYTQNKTLAFKYSGSTWSDVTTTIAPTWPGEGYNDGNGWLTFPAGSSTFRRSNDNGATWKSYLNLPSTTGAHSVDYQHYLETGQVRYQRIVTTTSEVRTIAFSGSTGGQTAQPHINLVSGSSFSSPASVSITCPTTGATIRYTTDGSTPTSTNGTVYAGAFNLTQSATIKVRAFGTGKTDSRVAASNITIVQPALGVFTTNADLGGSTPAGASSFNASTGIYTVSGANGLQAEKYQWLFKDVTGDFVFTAKVLSHDFNGGTNVYGRLGMIVRQGTVANNPMFELSWFNSGNGIELKTRATQGGSLTAVTGSPVYSKLLPYFLRIRRTGNVFISEISADGVTFTALGAPQTLVWSSNLQVGLFIGPNESVLRTGTFSDVSITGTPVGGDTENPSTPTALVSSNITATSAAIFWTASTDNVGVTSYDVYQNGTLVGNSTTTSYNATGLSSGVTYSFTILAKDAAGNSSNQSSGLSVTTLDNVAPSAPSGLFSLSVTATSATINWVASTDNIGVSSYDVYRDGTLMGNSTTTSYNATGLSSGVAYTFTVLAKDAAGNTSNQSSPISVKTNIGIFTTNADLGGSTPAGSSSFNTTSGIYTISGANGLQAEKYQWVYRDITGDFVYTAKVLSHNFAGGVNVYGRLGMIIRQGTVANNPMVELSWFNSGNGIELKTRSTQGGTLTAVTGSPVYSKALPYWLRIARVGNVFTSEISPDGLTFTALGAPQTLAWASTLQVGLFIGPNETIVRTGTFSNVTITQNGTPLNAANAAGSMENKDLETSNDIVVYPNPTRDIIHIGPKHLVFVLELFDSASKKLKSEKGNTMIVSGYKPGTYFLRISNDNKTVTKKIVIE